MSNKAETPLHGVIELLPVQNVIEHLPHVPSVQSVVEHLPERFRPEPKRRSRRPAVIAVLLLAVLVVVLLRRRSSVHDVAPYDGSATPTGRDATFVDVR